MKQLKIKVLAAVAVAAGFAQAAQYVEIDPDAFFNGFKEGYAGKTNVFSEEEVREIMTKFQAELRAKAELKRAELAEKNLKEGEKFLEENKKKEGVKTTESGLQYKVIKEGEGDRTLTYWREVHELFLRNELASVRREFDENTKVVCEEFEIVYQPSLEEEVQSLFAGDASGHDMSDIEFI